jgi:hypothetical protein
MLFTLLSPLENIFFVVTLFSVLGEFRTVILRTHWILIYLSFMMCYIRMASAFSSDLNGLCILLDRCFILSIELGVFLEMYFYVNITIKTGFRLLTAYLLSSFLVFVLLATLLYQHSS